MRSLPSSVSLSSILLPVVVAAATNYPLPIPCTGEACTTFRSGYQDGNIIRRPTDNLYFRYSRAQGVGTGLTLATAPALVGPWTLSKYEPLNSSVHLSDPSITNRSNTHLWAPEVHLIDGTYYLYYGVFDSSTPNEKGFDIAVATSPTMDEGTWVDHGSIRVPEDHKLYASLGANLIVNNSATSAEGGSHHLAWGSYNNGLFGAEMANPPLRVAATSKPRELIEDQPIGGQNKTEGAFQLRHGDFVYLFYSRGNCCPGPSVPESLVYRVEVCRAKQPTGPYTDRTNKSCLGSSDGKPNGSGTVLLESHSDGQVFAPGGIGVLNDAAEGLVMYYQYYNKTDGKVGPAKFGFNYLSFDEENWPVLVAKKSNAKGDDQC